MRPRRFASTFALIVLTAAAGSFSTPSKAGGAVKAAHPQSVLSAAGRLGEAELVRDGFDDPMIRGRIGDKKYFVYFYGCTEGRDCTNLTFSARWKSDQFTDESMGDWNREKRFGKAYLDADGNPTVELSVNLFGGVSRENLEDTADWWRLVVTEFAEFFGL